MHPSASIILTILQFVFPFDDWDRPTTMTGAIGLTECRDYDDLGRVLEIDDPWANDTPSVP